MVVDPVRATPHPVQPATVWPRSWSPCIPLMILLGEVSISGVEWKKVYLTY
jgi:hypothetical protein